MTWNYRIFKRNYDGETLYELHDTFYNEEGKPDSWTEDPQFGPCESVHDLIEELTMMLKDAGQYKDGVLNYYDEESDED